jgi:hypothetical protein
MHSQHCGTSYGYLPDASDILLDRVALLLMRLLLLRQQRLRL